MIKPRFPKSRGFLFSGQKIFNAKEAKYSAEF